ncbi:MAG: ExbD/TolR family protein [Burkholderiales bacterium]
MGGTAYPRRRQRRMVAEMNVVPYIDVMLDMLIIFMVSAPLLSPAVVDLPSVGKAVQAPKGLPFEIIVRADGSLAWRDRNDSNASETSATREQIVQIALKKQQQKPDLPVVIAGDKAVRYEAVMQVMDALQKQGVKRVGLLVRPGAGV